MIANVHRYRSSLPGRRAELYVEICEVFLGKRQQARGIELELTPAQSKRVLQPLAFHMMRTEKREIALVEAVEVIEDPLAQVNPRITGPEFLQMVENSSGLLLARENGVYSFAHLTFQEYLAASHLLEEKREDELVACVAIPWWHETIRLYVALADATRIVEACIAGGFFSVPKLTLAVECLEEARAVRPELRDTIERIIIDGLEDSDPERARLGAEARLVLRLRRLTRLDDDHYADNDLISCAEYQLFIDERRAMGDFRQPDHWKGTHFPPGLARAPVVGVRSSDAEEFCRWLSERQGGEWFYQIPERDLGDTIAARSGYWVRTSKGTELCGAPDSEFQITLEMLARRNLADLHTVEAALCHARDLNLDRVRADFERGVDRALHGTRALDLDRALDSGCDLDPAFHGAHALYVDLARALARRLALALDFDHSFHRFLDLEIALDLDLALDRALDPGRDHARAAIRLLVLRAVASLDRGRPVRWYEWRKLLGRSPLMQADPYLDLYVSLAILEERIEGKLPAFEGIRIMKVRKIAVAAPATDARAQRA